MVRRATSRRGREPKFRSTSPPEGSNAPALVARAALPSNTVALARSLVGMLLVRAPDTPLQTIVVARIVETEAYLPGDSASHAFAGPTPRNRTMFAGRGLAYVYFIYGNHFCLNVVSERRGVGAAVLVRAAIVCEGIATVRERCGPRQAEREFLRGPGRLARALGIDRTFDGVDLCRRGRLWLAHPPRDARAYEVGTSVRIGITKNAAAPLRFFARGERAVSGPKYLSAN